MRLNESKTLPQMTRPCWDYNGGSKSNKAKSVQIVFAVWLIQPSNVCLKIKN